MSKDKLPALQFYTGDWRKDPGVQALDHELKGIWSACLCHGQCVYFKDGGGATGRRGYKTRPGEGSQTSSRPPLYHLSGGVA
jgi:hypothetical protein